MKKGGSVYILTNISNDVLYIGVTSDLFFRLQDHKSKKYSASYFKI
jgi:putative endonuclease